MRRIAVLTILIMITLTACSAPKPAPTPTPVPTSTPTNEPTATPEPTSTPEPVPPILAMLNEYYSSHEREELYHIKAKPAASYSDGEYEMKLVCDEVPDSNGTAIIKAKSNQESFEIDFSYSNFLGVEVCSPELIKAVSVSTIKALGEYQGIDNIDSLVSDTVASYDDEKYTTVVSMGDFAVVFKPKDTYATVLSVIKMDEFAKSITVSDYEDAAYSDLSAKLNQGSKYHIKGIVKTYESGQYTNDYYTYKCKLAMVELETAETLTIAQFPEKVPINFEEGNQYDFYGTTMFDRAGNLLFYLHYAE